MPARSTMMTELVYWIDIDVGGEEEEAKRRRSLKGEREKNRFLYEQKELFLMNGMWTSWILRLSDDEGLQASLSQGI
jgi:hypothetical protein